MKKVIVFALCLLSFAHTQQGQKPRYSYIKNDELGITVTTLHWQIITLNFNEGQDLKIEINADSGVNIMVASLDPSFKLGFDPATAGCDATHVFKYSVECILPVNPALIIQDSRSVGTVIAGLASKGGAATDRMAAQNKVLVTLYTYECIATCPK